MKKTPKKLKNLGFTMLEILLVVAAIAILAGIVIVAINPGKQLAETRNAKRNSNVNTILNAIYQYSIDNNGAMPTSLTAGSGTACDLAANQICRTDIATPDCSGLVDLSELTVNETYLVNLPSDPRRADQIVNQNSTGYNTVLTGNNRIQVCAPLAERGVTISVTR